MPNCREPPNGVKDVFTRLFGMSAEEVEQLRVEGVI